ncbi:PAS domain S-box protein [Chitinophaga niabensis]|uniref:Sensory/regulatory protein RpfC n=1 Tax=Chitinophaga niabensis TaxID=536979 RepID=A0A1N6D4S1_9BACT|nr:PAS domain S-box protein [Chitinophaga niabensis]SIN65733.1 PAS domain S-box-containing protein [Chitinophaga niabensis]
MNKQPDPQHEKERLKALHKYNILDTRQEEEFDKITELASAICGMPVSLITIIDKDREWVKSRVGIEVNEIKREESICMYTIMEPQLFEVPDASIDPRFANIPQVKGPEHIRFYAGYPLIDKDNFALGVLCVIDRKPNKLTDTQRHSLKLLADTVVSYISDKRKNQELYQFEQLFKLSNDMICIAGVDGFFKKINPAFTRVLGFDEADILETPILDFVHPDDVEDVAKEVERLNAGVSMINFTRRFKTRSGDYKLLQWVANPEVTTGDIFAIGRDITEERNKEHLLEISENKLSAFFEHSQGLMCTHDLNGRFISVNTAGAELLGFTLEEMSTKGLTDIIPESHIPAFHAYLHTIESVGKASGQMTTIHKDGSPRIWMFNNILEKGVNGEAPYIIANAIDITERYFLEKDLARTKEMLEQTNQVARVGGWVAEVSKEKIFWTDMTKELHEVPMDFEPDMETAIRFFKKGESQNRVVRALNEALTQGKSWDLEVELITAKGNIRWVRTLGNAEFEGGSCKRLYGAFQDINQKKRSELEVTNSRKLLRDVLQSASEVSIVATDRNGHITLFNSGAERLLGYKEEEVIGKLMPELLHDEGEVMSRASELSLEKGVRVEGMQVFAYIPEKEGSEQREWIYVKKDGSRCIVSLVMTAILDARKITVGYLAIATDITKRKKMEEALITAKLQAEQMSSAKSEFLANMSHEIRTPLNGIIGFTGLVMRTPLDETQLQYLTIVNQSAGILLSIINDILDLSKIEAGKLELHMEQLDLFKLGSEATDIISYQAQNKGLDVLFNISDDLPRFVIGDPLRLKQVLMNLLGNAVKFTETGEIELRISAITDPYDDRITFKFEVRDTGIGIKAHKQEKIFEAFAQEDASTTKKYGGTGIGLAISNKILALMGSRLQLISYPGGGSTFYFYVTLEAAREVTLEPETATGSIESLQLEDIAANVLVVEDNTVNMLLTKVSILKLMPKANIIEAGNGLDAVQICRLKMPDIILMDIQIPEINGYEATMRIRSLEREGEHVPIIALTAGNISGEKEKSISAGMDDFLSKPIVQHSLAAILSKWLGRKSPVMEEVVHTGKEQHFNEEVLRGYLGEDNISNDILLLTASEIRRSFETLAQHVQDQDLKGIHAIGHKLYGTAATVGLEILAVYAKQFEYIPSFEEAAVKEMLAKASAELTLVLDIIHQRIAGGK